MPVDGSWRICEVNVMELEEKIEELEGLLANLKVEIKGLLIELKELALRGQDPIRQNRPQAMVSAATP